MLKVARVTVVLPQFSDSQSGVRARTSRVTRKKLKMAEKGLFVYSYNIYI
jgi:hypothetical protein